MTSHTRNAHPIFNGKSLMHLLTVLFVMVSMLTQTTPALAATYTVTTNLDSGAGSLRAAIASATGGSDTINFGAGLSGQTILLDTELVLANSVTIDASTLATPVTLDGQEVRVFVVNGGTTVTLKNLKIMNSGTVNIGGGISNAGTLTVLNSTISGNNTTTTSGKGGGIYSTGTLTVTDSTISGNTSSGTSANTSGGGGIYSSGTLTVDGSTFSSNSTSSGNGGAIYNTGTATISNSTFSGNSGANGGAIFNGGTITIRNSTISGNSASVFGGGVNQSAGTLNMANVILANSSAGFDCYVAGGSLGTNTKNIIEGNAGSPFDCGTPFSTVDPALGGLVNNGGSTFTMAIGQTSSALNAGDAGTCTTVGNLDQRNTSRPQGAACDIGAFEAVLYKLTVNKTGSSGTGTITSDVTGISCGSGAGCNEDYVSGLVVTLTATPDAGSVFTGWSGGGCSGTGTCQVTMDAAKTVTGVFATAASLAISKNGSGTGTVTSSPSGINCGATCLYSFALNTVVTLTATADGGSVFAGWSGEGCSGTGTCQVTMNAAKLVTATFNTSGTPTFTLTVLKPGAGAGKVTSSPLGIDCGATCAYAFNTGVLVTLNASADPGSVFAGWTGGGCSGTGACQVTMSSAQAVAATFNISATPTYALTVTKDGSGTGVVASDVSGINCGSACTSSYNSGTVVTLTATPDAGSTFAGWTGGGCSGTGTCVVTMSAAQSVTATFNMSASTFELFVSKVGTGTGVITSDVGGIDCGATCAVMINTGTIVTLTATPDSGIAFNGWIGGGCSGTGTCAVTMSSAQTVIAVFGTPTTFTDVPVTHWAYTFIERLYNAGITAGCTSAPLAYCPDAPVTRASMAIFILRGMNGSGYTPPAATGTVFTDVPTSYWAAAWIEALSTASITSGCGGGNYCPDANITRAQMAIFLLRGKYGSVYTPPAAVGTIFTDVPTSYWAAAWIEALAAEGITSGCGGGNYCPESNVTRDQMAVFLVRTFDLP